MPVKLPRDSKERIRVMLAVIKQGEATFELDGVKHTLTRLELEPPEPKFDLLAYVRSFFKKR